MALDRKLEARLTKALHHLATASEADGEFQQFVQETEARAGIAAVAYEVTHLAD